jgi:hypothetical protein
MIILDVFLLVSIVDAGSMHDILKVVIPDSEVEENDVYACKRCGEVHGVKDIEECRRVCREQSRCTRCGLIHRLCHLGLHHRLL